MEIQIDFHIANLDKDAELMASNNTNLIKYLPRTQFDRLLDHLSSLGYELFGPIKRDQAIVYDRIDNAEDLPIGWQDQQDGGSYRLEETGDASIFSYVVGPESWKKFIFKNQETLFTVQRDEEGKLVFQSAFEDPGKRAFIGIRSCELHGIAVQDRVFIHDDYVDPGYAKCRDNLLFVAVNCTRAASTCFCKSMQTGPQATAGFDLALTEVLNGEEHYFTLEIGSTQGAQVIEGLELVDANETQISTAQAANDQAKDQKRSLNTTELKERLYNNLENEKYWADVAERCLNCANCTQVCPTCFCSTVEETTALDGSSAGRVRYWDSCFNLNHSHIAGGSVRQSGASRYRQWLTHKLASWHDQFDTSGCVGCGRCIAWCPVGYRYHCRSTTLT